MRYDGIQVGGKLNTNGIKLLPEESYEPQKTSPMAALFKNLGNMLSTGDINGNSTSTNNNSTSASAFNQ